MATLFFQVHVPLTERDCDGGRTDQGPQISSSGSSITLHKSSRSVIKIKLNALAGRAPLPPPRHHRSTVSSWMGLELELDWVLFYINFCLNATKWVSLSLASWLAG